MECYTTLSLFVGSCFKPPITFPRALIFFFFKEYVPFKVSLMKMSMSILLKKMSVTAACYGLSVHI